MVAIIKSGYSIHRIFNYNENKVKEGIATCIGAGNYPLDPEDMTVSMRLNGLLKRVELAQRAQRNSVHISLNFDPSEKDLPADKLMEIAGEYMEQIGFGKQPFLIYQHYDAGHPHLHIVTTDIKPDGKAIDMYLIGAKKSEPARKSIEKKFGLVAAGDKEARQLYLPEPVSLKQIAYGKNETKKAIQNVLEHIIKQYKYTSLPELNAVLGRYNIMAQRGDENSRVYRHSGLLYRVLDPHGNPVGVPIKASLFYSKPTLKNLQEYFTKNDQARLKHKARVKNAIDMAVKGNPGSFQQFEKQLSSKGIDLVLRQNDIGYVYGVTYVDHVTKSVFNGSALGKAYSAKAIRERCGIPQTEMFTFQQVKEKAIPTRKEEGKPENTETPGMSNAEFRSLASALIDLLTQEEFVPERLPYELSLRKRKKRRKRKLDNNN